MAQAEEAKDRGLVKLAEDITDAIGTEPASELVHYSYGELQDDVRKDLWKLATRLIAYYDVGSVDAEKMQQTILYAASKIVDDLEVSLGVDSVVVGPLEQSVPGETK